MIQAQAQLKAAIRERSEPATRELVRAPALRSTDLGSMETIGQRTTDELAAQAPPDSALAQVHRFYRR